MSIAQALFNTTALHHPYSLFNTFSLTYYSSLYPPRLSNCTVVDPDMPGNRLFETSQGEILLISKTPAEVAGEKFLRPLVNIVNHIGSRMISNGLIALAEDFGKSCFSLASSISFPQLTILPIASAQPSDPPAGVHKEKEEGAQDLLVEVTTPTFPTWQDIDVFPPPSTKPSSQALLPSDPSQVISFQYPPLFTTILISPKKIDWSSPEFDKASLVSMRDPWNRTIFLAAVEEGRGEAMRVLLTHDIAVYTVDSHGNNGLALAALNGYSDLIPLLSNYFPVNGLNAQGLAPIHHAIRQGQSQVVQALARNGASLSIGYKSPQGIILSPTALAVMSGSIPTLEVLIKEDYQGDIDLTQSISGIGTLVHLAIYTEQAPMLEYLLETQHIATQELLEHVDFLGRTPLHLASYRGNLPAIRVLVRQGADIERADKENERKPIHFAALGKQSEAIRLLDWLDAPLQSTDKEGRTPEVLLKSQLGQLKEEELSLASQCLALLDKLPRVAKKYKAQPPDFSRHPPINLIFQGGGLKQIAYAGAIRKMEELNALSEVKRVAGTSAGAITTALLSVGYTSSELTHFFSHNFIELIEKKFLETFEEGVSKAMLEYLKAALTRYWVQWKKKPYPNILAKELYRDLLTFIGYLAGFTGLYEGEEFRKQMDNLIQQATKTQEHPEGIKHCTFGELHDLVLRHPGKYRDPYIFSIQLSKLDPSDITRFSYEDIRWRNLIISDAIRASVSIPMVFKPHILHLKDPLGTRYPVEVYGAFVDGGLIRNFPLDAFDDKRYQQNKRDWGGATNRRTLGLSLQVVSEITPERIDEIESAKDLLQAVVSTYFHAGEILAYKESYNQDRAILISAGKDIGFMRPDVENTGQQAFLKAGEEAVLLFFQNSLGRDPQPIIDPARTEDIRLFSPHPDFVGRKEYLDLLEKALIVNPKGWDIRLPVKVRLLWGLGGMGKSELAIKFANSHLNNFSIVWTIHHENEASIDQGYRELAERLKIFTRDKPSTQQVQRKVHAYLENNPFEKPWLLLLDNVENQIKQHDLPQRGGVVLITARHSFVRTSVEERIKVEGLSKMEAVTLLSRITGEKESEEMYQLAEDLGNFPLALNQAAHYIKDTPASSIAKYQRVYSLAKDPLRGPAYEDDRYQYTLKTVWNITFEKLGKESPDTIYWLKACAHLAPAEIPLNWLETWAGGVAESEGILRTLQQYALMKHDKAEDSLFLHKLLQMVIRVQAPKNEVVKIQESLLLLFSKIGNSLDTTQPSSWKMLAKWEPHASYIVQFGFIPIHKGHIFNKLGLWSSQKGKYQKALEYHEEALKIRKELREENYLHAASLNNIGTAYSDLGNHKEALYYYQKALALQKELYGKEHSQVAICLNNVGTAYSSLGNSQEALLYHQKALIVWEKIYDKEHPHLASGLNNVGEAYRTLGNFQEALSYFQKALTIRERVYSKEHPDIVNSLSSIGGIYVNLGKFQKALPYFLETLTIQEKVYGKEHPRVADSLNNIGGVYNNLGKSQEALPYLQKALFLQEEIYGKEHSNVAKCLNDIGTAYNNLDKSQEALLYLQKALAIWEKIFGKEHPHVASCLYNIGIAYDNLDKLQEALSHYQGAMAIWKKSHGKEHLLVANSLNNIGLIYEALGNQKKAQKYFERGEAIQNKA